MFPPLPIPLPLPPRPATTPLCSPLDVVLAFLLSGLHAAALGRPKRPQSLLGLAPHAVFFGAPPRRHIVEELDLVVVERSELVLDLVGLLEGCLLGGCGCTCELKRPGIRFPTLPALSR